MPKSPVRYSAAVAQRILDELARGRTLKEICRDAGMPAKSNVFAWARSDRDGFGARYRAVRHVRGLASCYSPALAERICDELRGGRPLGAVCADAGMPSDRVVRQWIASDRDGFRARYWQARGIGYLALADEIIEIADHAAEDWLARRDGAPARPRGGAGSVAHARLRISARCWLLSKMLPRAFGHTLSVEPPHDRDAALRALLAAIDGRTRGLPSDDGATRAALQRPGRDRVDGDGYDRDES